MKWGAPPHGEPANEEVVVLAEVFEAVPHDSGGGAAQSSSSREATLCALPLAPIEGLPGWRVAPGTRGGGRVAEGKLAVTGGGWASSDCAALSVELRCASCRPML